MNAIRRVHFRAFAALFTLSLTLCGVFAAPAAPASAAPVSAVTHIAITVSDLDRSIDFFTRTLDFTLVDQSERADDALEHLTGVFGARVRTAVLRLGDERIELDEFLAPQGRPIPPDSRSNDLWFQHIAIVVSDMDRAYARLRAAKVRHASSGPQTLPLSNPNAGGISAFYFKDPDNHVLEIIRFPPGKGDPRWQSPAADRLFLGIDHTAIAVSDTDASLRFYQGTLGLRIAGASENFGAEQEHLNNVFGARVRITALRAASGPGVELLEYLAPTTGRPAPVDSRACDLWHWHTAVAAPSIDVPASALRAAHAAWVSPGVVTMNDSSALMVKDPDGHALLIAQPAAAPPASAAIRP